MPSFNIEFKQAMYIAGGVILAYWLFKADLKNGVKAAGNAINPVSPDNIFNLGTEALYQGVTGSDQQIGADFYDLTHNLDGSTNNVWSWMFDKVVL